MMQRATFLRVLTTLASVLMVWLVLMGGPIVMEPCRSTPLTPPCEGGERGGGKDGPPAEETWAATFSIAAYDPDRKEWGVGVASKALAVGSVVPWAKAGVGAVATQALVNGSYGPKGLELLADGKSPDETVKELTSTDKSKEYRQVGVVDRDGKVANFTGEKCISWAGAKSGKNFTCQGNLLAGEAVITDMAKAFEGSKGPLGWRIVTALEAADKAGGDKRGKQSAALIVVRDKGGPNGFGDRAIDLRVDDHKEPIGELARILGLRIRRP